MQGLLIYLKVTVKVAKHLGLGGIVGTRSNI